MRRRGLVLLFCCAALAAREAMASVIVVANRARAEVTFALAAPAEEKSAARSFTLASGEVSPILIAGPVQLTYTSADEKKSFRVVPHGMYYFSEPRGGQLELGQIGLSMPEVSLKGHLIAEKIPVEHATTATPRLVIPVKILYDHIEVTTPKAWEKRIRARFDEANRILKKHCFVEFEIKAVESWHSDGSHDSLEQLLGDFEQKVDPGTARVAIGFTARHRPDFRDPHMGGTRGPLHTHLVLREHVNQNSEAERLEILVHELGHFLGAVHSPESSSVMRPILGDRQARAARFHIAFDPLNTLAMCLVSEELSSNPRVKLAEMPPFTRVELFRVYLELARAVPKDPTAVRYMNRLGLELRQVPAADPAP